MEIRVHIERLILEGFDLSPGGQAAFQAALAGELRRLLEEGSVAPELSGGAALPGVSAGSLHLTGLENPSQLGVKVAGALFTGIGGEPAPASERRAPESESRR